jgi:hypothetical protein
MRARVESWGVDMIELVYPSEAAVAKAVAPWGKPRDGDSGFRWSVWTNASAGIRAIQMQGETRARDRVELLPFRPLAELLASGGELAFEGKHLLDVDRSLLAALPKAGDSYQMLPTELSSGHIPLQVDAKGYTLGVDWTYDHAVREEVKRLLVAHWGEASDESDEPLSRKSCMRFAPKGGVRARACTLYTQWQITIARDDH